MTIEDQIIAQVLTLGLDDWVDLGWVRKIVNDHVPNLDSEQMLQWCLKVVRTMLSKGLVDVGDLSGEGGRFRRWQMDHQAALNQIERRWRHYGDVIGDGTGEVGGDFLCWLSNTEEGDRLAKERF